MNSGTHHRMLGLRVKLEITYLNFFILIKDLMLEILKLTQDSIRSINTKSHQFSRDTLTL